MPKAHRIRRLEGDPHLVTYRPDGEGSLEVDPAGIKSTGGAWLLHDDESRYDCVCGESFTSEQEAAQHVETSA